MSKIGAREAGELGRVINDSPQLLLKLTQMTFISLECVRAHVLLCVCEIFIDVKCSLDATLCHGFYTAVQGHMLGRTSSVDLE